MSLGGSSRTTTKKEITDISIRQNVYLSEEQKKEKLETCSKLIQYTRLGLIDGIIKALQDGAAIDYKTNGLSAIGYACFYGRSEIVRWLIDNGKCDIEINSTATETTPLGISIQKGDLRSVEILLERGANTLAKDKDGLPIFYHALASKNIDIVKKLYETQTIDMEEKFPEYVEDQSNQNSSNNANNTNTIIHLAAISSPEIVEYLTTTCGVSLESINSLGRTILHRAIMFKNFDLKP
ncbi:hypothetical protein ACTFIU_005593 [Dictyostelium citrinum]